MSTIEIAKDAIPWDACATVVTGILAVGAAIYVGRRQTAIADRQVQLLARQAYLQGMSYREALFERRFVVYAATQELIGHIMRDADGPPLEKCRPFLQALDQAKFLFDPKIEVRLRIIWKDCCQLKAIKSVMNANFARTGDYGQSEIDEEYVLLNKFAEIFENLSEVFGDELKLAD